MITELREQVEFWCSAVGFATFEILAVMSALYIMRKVRG